MAGSEAPQRADSKGDHAGRPHAAEAENKAWTRVLQVATDQCGTRDRADQRGTAAPSGPPQRPREGACSVAIRRGGPQLVETLQGGGGVRVRSIDGVRRSPSVQ